MNPRRQQYSVKAISPSAEMLNGYPIVRRIHRFFFVLSVKRQKFDQEQKKTIKNMTAVLIDTPRVILRLCIHFNSIKRIGVFSR